MMVPKQPPGPHCEYMRYQRCFRTVRTEAAASKNHVQVVNLALFAPSITRHNLTVGSCYCSVTRLYTNIFFTIPTPQDAPKRWQQQCSQFLTTISYCLGYMVQFFFSCLLTPVENIFGANSSGILQEKRLLQIDSSTPSTSPSKSWTNKDLQP